MFVADRKRFFPYGALIRKPNAFFLQEKLLFAVIFEKHCFSTKGAGKMKPVGVKSFPSLQKKKKLTAALFLEIFRSRAGNSRLEAGATSNYFTRENEKLDFSEVARC